jgi:SPW repeat-containing protein
MKYMPWILAVIASWLIAAPFLLGYAETEPAMHNDVGVGVVMLLGALAWGFSEWRSHGLTTGMQAQRR